MSPTIQTSSEDKVGTIALDNYAKRHALGAATVREMLVALGRFESEGVRAVVVHTAEPAHVWSAGHDIEELPLRGVDPLPFGDPLAELLRAVRAYPGAVIAMVHGTVWGGACDLVLNCDMVVGDETAAFAVTPARLGLPYSASGIQYFLARLPINIVNELIMTADLITADRAYTVEIMNHLVGADELAGVTYALARTVRSRSGEAIRAYKLQATAMVRAVALSAQDSQWINQLRHEVYSGDDYAEGIAAFVEKRRPTSSSTTASTAELLSRHSVPSPRRATCAPEPVACHPPRSPGRSRSTYVSSGRSAATSRPPRSAGTMTPTGSAPRVGPVPRWPRC